MEQTKNRPKGQFFAKVLRFYALDNFGEDSRLLFSEHGQNLAIQTNVRLLQKIDKAGIGQAIFTNRGIDLNRPQVAEGALLGAAITEGVGASFEHGWAGKADFALAAPLVAFYALQEILAALYMLCTTFYSRHSLGAIRQCFLEGLAQSRGHGHVGSLVASGVPRFARIEVILAGFALEDLARRGDFYSLGSSFVSLHCHITDEKVCGSVREEPGIVKG